MMRITVLDGGVINPGDIEWTPLEKFGEVKVYEDTPPSLFAERVAGADIILVNKTRVDAENLEALSCCQMVGVLATGVNNIDLQGLAQAGITVCNTPAYGVEDVAQHALALLMELARGTALHTRSILAGDWQKSGQWCYWLKPPLCLAGLTLGIIGFGAIGQAMGRIGRALDMNILACSKSRKANPGYSFTWANPEEIWKNSDVISLHCPLTPETDKIINTDSIAAMRNGVILINTARGALIDEDAAAAALKSGKLAGLGTDVLSIEPPEASNPLLSAPNVLITPHIAWATVRARRKIIELTAQNIACFLAGNPCNVVNNPVTGTRAKTCR